MEGGFPLGEQRGPDALENSEIEFPEAQKNPTGRIREIMHDQDAAGPKHFFRMKNQGAEFGVFCQVRGRDAIDAGLENNFFCPA